MGWRPEVKMKSWIFTSAVFPCFPGPGLKPARWAPETCSFSYSGWRPVAQGLFSRSRSDLRAIGSVGRDRRQGRRTSVPPWHSVMTELQEISRDLLPFARSASWRHPDARHDWRGCSRGRRGLLDQPRRAPAAPFLRIQGTCISQPDVVHWSLQRTLALGSAEIAPSHYQ